MKQERTTFVMITEGGLASHDFRDRIAKNYGVGIIVTLLEASLPLPFTEFPSSQVSVLIKSGLKPVQPNPKKK